jgi:ElaB/YqjD/DUF883 family membrane-anchored ribosome-binding protein
MASNVENTSGKARTTERAAAAAHETVDRIAERAERAERSVREQADAAEERARESAQRLWERGADELDRVRGFVDEHPVAALGIAFGVGVIVSSWLRGRR